MIKISYPDHPFKIRNEKGSDMIFDELRRAWLLLTPEEWVRQNFVQYLVQVMQYPPTLVALEKKIMVGEMSKRFDLLVYDRDHRPWMMVECKAMTVPLKEDVLHQVLRYHIAVPVHYLVITNGAYCMAFRKEYTQLAPLDKLPPFES